MQYLIPSISVIDMKSTDKAKFPPDPVTPTALDVLCGTGIERINQPGNELFGTIVFKYVEKYTCAESKKEKMAISKGALDELSSSGVRFLKKHPVHQCWYVADSKVGRDRIGHFLRQHLLRAPQRGARRDNTRRVSCPSPHVRPLVTLSNSIHEDVGNAACEAADDVRFHGGTPNRESDSPAPTTRSSLSSPSTYARNINIVPTYDKSCFSALCSKEKGNLSRFSPSSQSDDVPCGTPPFKGCRCVNVIDNVSLLNLNNWSSRHNPQMAAPSFDSFPKKYVPVGDSESLASDVDDDLVDLFDDADLAECLDWQSY
jgi:hypothetical protein